MQVEPGTFLIRFSETKPGSFTIGYRGGYPSGETEAKHYLVTPSDHALHKTLPDFICQHAQFRDLLQLITDPASGQLVLMKVNKHAALDPFCSKRQRTPEPFLPAKGYTPLCT
eukprot:TRINITY_DN1212_c0_g1_i3.p3 TRINITY_DN1212_c0_g1~~TRINITY_DN1212_c0_g1_i3.p3  ORF type:complete len:113 (+),score=26.87 TRINITY_DN1212_c0_g1_i3:394-732(+)